MPSFSTYLSGMRVGCSEFSSVCSHAYKHWRRYLRTASGCAYNDLVQFYDTLSTTRRFFQFRLSVEIIVLCFPPASSSADRRDGNVPPIPGVALACDFALAGNSLVPQWAPRQYGSLRLGIPMRFLSE